MKTRAIVPIKLSLSEGDFYTLWAPSWRQNGSEWQAFLGTEEDVLVFESEGGLLTYIDNHRQHDLADHPQWENFNSRPADRVVPRERDVYDLIGMPEYLAGRPSHENVSTVARNLELAQSLAAVAGAEHTTIFFASHSVLRNVSRGSDHYAGEHGMHEWTGVGRVVAGNWKDVIEELDGKVRVVPDSELGADATQASADSIAAATAAAEKSRAEEEARREQEKAQADPYDNSVWAAAGIDPIKITIDNQSVYSLRTYVDGNPIFLGKWGEIRTFDSPKTLIRWIIDNDDHDLATVSTWEDIVSAANAGDIDFTVHPDNEYTFNGITQDIEKGPEAVDSEQMGRCYEVCADAADWAGDDSVNSLMLSNPRFQDYLGYMLGSTEHAGYVPSKPYTDHAEAWKKLEDILVKRFSKF